MLTKGSNAKNQTLQCTVRIERTHLYITIRWSIGLKNWSVVSAQAERALLTEQLDARTSSSRYYTSA